MIVEKNVFLFFIIIYYHHYIHIRNAMQLLAQNFVSCILNNTMNFKKKKKSKTIIVAVVQKNERRKTGVNICTHFNKNKKKYY